MEKVAGHNILVGRWDHSMGPLVRAKAATTPAVLICTHDRVSVLAK